MRNPLMDNGPDRGLSRSPQQLPANDGWYYEVRGGIQVYAQTVARPLFIPWRKLRASLKRKDAVGRKT